MRFAIFLAALTLPSPSAAFVCIFQTECYEEQSLCAVCLRAGSAA